MSWRGSALLAVVIALGAADVRAQTVTCDEWITSLPVERNNANRNLCLAKDLRSGGAAPAITLDFTMGATLDLNGHSIIGPGSGVGIRCMSCMNVVIRNGTVEGFGTGVVIDTSSPVSTGVVIEDLTVQRPTEFGIKSDAWGIIVRNNRVIDVGRNTQASLTYGVAVTGPRSRILNNDIIEMRVDDAPPGQDTAIHVFNARGTIVEGNRITLTPSRRQTVGIMVEGSERDGDVLVIGNRVSDVMWGIYFSGGLGKYRDNVTVGVANPFTGGRDAGNNN